MRTSLKESRTSKHRIIECLPYLKKHAMKNYVKEEATDLDEDEVEAKKDLVKTKMSISTSIGSHRYRPWRIPRICLIQWTICTKISLETQLKECEENIQWLLHKKTSYQGAIRSRWSRQWQRSRSINYNFEWFSKSSRESCPSRNITYE